MPCVPSEDAGAEEGVASDGDVESPSMSAASPCWAGAPEQAETNPAEARSAVVASSERLVSPSSLQSSVRGMRLPPVRAGPEGPCVACGPWYPMVMDILCARGGEMPARGRRG